MSNFAFNDVYKLVHKFESITDDHEREAHLIYICALFSELAYFHIPEWEIDAWKRAKIVPSKSLRYLSKAGKGKGGTDIASVQDMDIPKGFVVSTRGAIALGQIINDKLFIAIRGTKFLYDWRINFRAKLTSVPLNSYHYCCGLTQNQTKKTIRLHSGFAFEAAKIERLIKEEITKQGLGSLDIYLTGHSLGGAIAAILAELMREEEPRTITFGAPKYTDLSTYFDCERKLIPTQVRIPGDCVPLVPLRSKGYMEPLHEISTCGKEYFDPEEFHGFLGNSFRIFSFIRRKGEPHFMESYRKEVGRAINADGAEWPLLDIEKIKFRNLNP